MRNLLLAGVGLLCLSGCTAAQVSTSEADITLACQTAKLAVPVAQGAVHGGASATVASLAGYVQAGCGSEQAIAALVSKNTPVSWVNALTAGLQAAAAAPAG